MKRLTILVFQYYQLLLFNNILFSTMAAILISISLPKHVLFTLLSGKLLGGIASGGHYHFMHNKSYYYFRNSGLNMGFVFGCAFVLDVSIFIILFTLIHLCFRLF